jgi:hypothetical protein
VLWAGEKAYLHHPVEERCRGSLSLSVSPHGASRWVNLRAGEGKPTDIAAGRGRDVDGRKHAHPLLVRACVRAPMDMVILNVCVCTRNTQGHLEECMPTRATKSVCIHLCWTGQREEEDTAELMLGQVCRARQQTTDRLSVTTPPPVFFSSSSMMWRPQILFFFQRKDHGIYMLVQHACRMMLGLFNRPATGASAPHKHLDDERRRRARRKRRARRTRRTRRTRKRRRRRLEASSLLVTQAPALPAVSAVQ